MLQNITNCNLHYRTDKICKALKKKKKKIKDLISYGGPESSVVGALDEV